MLDFRCVPRRTAITGRRGFPLAGSAQRSRGKPQQRVEGRPRPTTRRVKNWAAVVAVRPAGDAVVLGPDLCARAGAASSSSSRTGTRGSASRWRRTAPAHPARAGRRRRCRTAPRAPARGSRPRGWPRTSPSASLMPWSSADDPTSPSRRGSIPEPLRVGAQLPGRSERSVDRHGGRQKQRYRMTRHSGRGLMSRDAEPPRFGAPAWPQSMRSGSSGGQATHTSLRTWRLRACATALCTSACTVPRAPVGGPPDPSLSPRGTSTRPARDEAVRPAGTRRARAGHRARPSSPNASPRARAQGQLGRRIPQHGEHPHRPVVSRGAHRLEGEARTRGRQTVTLQHVRSGATAWRNGEEAPAREEQEPVHRTAACRVHRPTPDEQRSARRADRVYGASRRAGHNSHARRPSDHEMT